MVSTTVAIVALISLAIRYVAAASFPKRCAEIAVLVDETFSMRAADQSALLVAAERIAQGLQGDALDYYPFVCVFGFGAFGAPSSKLFGCSLGFDATNTDIEFDRSGSVEDGWEALVSAVNFFSMKPLEINGISREIDCIDVSMFRVIVLGRTLSDEQLRILKRFKKQPSS